MTNQTQQTSGIQSINMLTWRLNRVSAEKHAADVNRELLRRQH